MQKSETDSDGLGLEYLDRLTLFDERFEYDGESYDYKSIEHIEFTASVTKHSVNGIPTGTSYAANLVLHLQGRARLHIQQESAFFGAKKKLRYEAVMRAASMLMGISFNQRIESYEHQLKQKKFIEWGQYQIHKDGDIFHRNQHCLNMRDPSVSLLLQPFEIAFRKKPSGSNRLVSLLY